MPKYYAALLLGCLLCFTAQSQISNKKVQVLNNAPAEKATNFTEGDFIKVNKGNVVNIHVTTHKKGPLKTLFTGAVKTVGTGIVTYNAVNLPFNNGKTQSFDNRKALIPAIGFGITAGYSDFHKALRKQQKAFIQFDYFNEKLQPVSTDIQPVNAKKGMQQYQSNTPADGYVKITVLNPAFAQLETAIIDIETPPPPKFAGAIAETFNTNSWGECLPTVCVKNGFTNISYDYRSDGSIWETVCTTTFEDCDDPGSTHCDDYMIQGPNQDNPWDEVVQVPNSTGCGVCYQTITHHSDGTDTYSDLYGCENGECNENGESVNDNTDTIPGNHSLVKTKLPPNGTKNIQSKNYCVFKIMEWVAKYFNTSLSEKSSLLWYIQNGGTLTAIVNGFTGNFSDLFNLVNNFFNCHAIADIGVTLNQIILALNSGEPIIATYWPSGSSSGHEVLITGYNDDGTVIYFDPETGTYFNSIPGNFIRVIGITSKR